MMMTVRDGWLDTMEITVILITDIAWFLMMIIKGK